MNHIRTPKAGETWIWMACDKHEHKHELEMRLKVAQIANGAYYPAPMEISPWWAVAVIAAGIAALLCFVVH